MMKKMIVLLIGLSTMCFGENSETIDQKKYRYFYTQGELAFIFPGVACGYRSHEGHHGMDFSAHMLMIELPGLEGGFRFHLKGAYLFYPWYSSNRFFNLGGGFMTNPLYERKYDPLTNILTPIPYLTIGYEKHFRKNGVFFIQLDAVGGYIPVLGLGMGF